MKKLLLLLLAVCLTAVCHAESKQVTTLSTSAAAVIVIPGPRVTILTISNVGAGAVNLTFDGSSSNGGTDPTTGATGNGMPLAAGQTVSFNASVLVGIKISAIMQTGTTTLNINTNAQVGNSTFPTN